MYTLTCRDNVQSWKNYSGVAPESPLRSRSRKATGNKDKAGQQRSPPEPAESHYWSECSVLLGIYWHFFPLIVVISLPEGNALAVLHQISLTPENLQCLSGHVLLYILKNKE